jgi:hypothetical protein
MAPASKKALAREETAKEAFRAAKKEFEENILPTAKGSFGKGDHVVQLLKPNIHLTSHTWNTFNKWVKKHDGWKAKRREATPEEKKEANAYHSGKSYFMDVMYETPDPKKKAAAEKRKMKKAEQAEAAAQKKQRMLEELAPKNRVGPFLFESLPQAVQLQVLSFVEVPTLNSLIRTSKAMSKVALQDEVWAPHLKFLLEELFDDAFGRPRGTMVPISKRANWQKSAEFRTWFQECDGKGTQCTMICKLSVGGMTLRMTPNKNDDHFKWLLEDVSLYEYYKQAGAFAYEGEAMEDQLFEDTNRCRNCNEKMWSCCCRRGDNIIVRGLFSKMPCIKLFRCDLFGRVEDEDDLLDDFSDY